MVCFRSHSHFLTGELQIPLRYSCLSKSILMKVKQEMRENDYWIYVD